jgi:hypothetical protein
VDDVEVDDGETRATVVWRPVIEWAAMIATISVAAVDLLRSRRIGPTQYPRVFLSIESRDECATDCAMVL